MSHAHTPLSVDKQNCPPSPITDANAHKKRTASRSSTPGPRQRPPAVLTGDKTPKHGLPSPPTSAGAGLQSPPPPACTDQPSPPPSASTEPPSPPTCVSTSVPMSPTQKASKDILEVFCRDWQYVVGPMHPNYLDGVELLGSLSAVSHAIRITPSSRYSYRGYSDPRRPIRLDKLTQIDLHALEYDACNVLTDQRTPRPYSLPDLEDDHDLRTALYNGEPIAFTLPSSPGGGIRSATLDVPGYIVLGHSKTLFAGAGTFCFLASSASKFTEAVLTQTVGKCLLVHFPMTPENRSDAYEHSHTKGQHLAKFRWALSQPGAFLRILLPGEHVFLSPHQMCALLCLGHNGCTYSATALSDVALAPEPRNQPMDVDSSGGDQAERATPSRHRPAASWG